MDFKTLLPDFEAIKKTDWAKPQLKVDTKDTMGLVMYAGAALMVIFTFFSWCTLTAGDASASKLGITTWYGIFAFICAAAAVVGVLYKHTTLTFTAATLGVLFAVLGIVLIPSLTFDGVTYNAEEIKELLKNNSKASLSHLGAILYLVATVATAAAYLKVTKK